MSHGYITNGTSQDGFGARLFREITTIAFTYYLKDKFNANLEYIHTPYTYEGFENFGWPEMVASRSYFDNHEPYNEVTREGYLNRAVLWENKLKYKGKTIIDINLNDFLMVTDYEYPLYSQLFHDISTHQTDNKLYIIRLGLRSNFDNNEFDANMVDWYFHKIKEKFLFIQPDVNNNLLIHIRRKDAIWDIHKSVRYLEDEYYLEILNALIPYKDQYNISIHTQRKNFDFTKYDGWNIIYDDEEQDYDLLIKMLQAKILIVGKSSLSMIAGYLNQKMVVFPPTITKGLDRFINKDQFINIHNKNLNI